VKTHVSLAAETVDLQLHTVEVRRTLLQLFMTRHLVAMFRDAAMAVTSGCYVSSN